MCMFKQPKMVVPKDPKPTDPEQAARRQAELAAAGPGRAALMASSPTGVPGFKGGAAPMLYG